jgi:hypothetical protein
VRARASKQAVAAHIPIEGSGYGPIVRRPDCVQYLVAMSTWGEDMGDNPHMDYGKQDRCECERLRCVEADIVRRNGVTRGCRWSLGTAGLLESLSARLDGKASSHKTESPAARSFRPSHWGLCGRWDDPAATFSEHSADLMGAQEKSDPRCWRARFCFT